MGKKLGILVIRGSGESGFKRQEYFFKKVFKLLERKGVDTTQIQIEYIDWYAYMELHQEKILDRLYSAGIKISGKTLRKLVITNIGDLINYGGIPNLPSKNYEKTHELVHKSIVSLKNNLVEDAPLILIASSFGTEIMNNYIWDRQHGKQPQLFGNSAFERFEMLVGYYCFGSTLPIFASSNDIDLLQPIEFPSINLDPKFKSIAVWENYYDKNDALGYPIKSINQKYAAAKLIDIQINVGNPLTFWNLVSHFGYWKSKKLVKRISAYIEKVLSAS
jgi:hypothetical protein